LTIQLGLQPLAGFMVLAIGAMAIAAAAIYHVVFTALGALIDGSTVMIGAAIDNGIDDFAMFRRHVITEALDIFRAVGCEDVFNRCHGHPLSDVPQRSSGR
jgi:hypothetical protein